MNILEKCNVQRQGKHGPTLVFGHGLGIDQNVWRLVAPMFASTHHVVLFDYVGCGQSQKSAFDVNRYRTLAGYAEDLLEICATVAHDDVIFVGHSVSAMVGVHALVQAPAAFRKFVMLGASPCYLNQPGYPGGFAREDIDALLAALRHDLASWAESMGPVLVGRDNQPQLIREMSATFARNDHDIMYHFAQVTLLSDSRPLLPHVHVPTCVIQGHQDAFVPDAIGAYVHQHIPHSKFVQLPVTGHCPQLVDPTTTAAAIQSYIENNG